MGEVERPRVTRDVPCSWTRVACGNRGRPTMERRKFVIGAGALATGSAAAMGTGAYSSVSAERTVSVQTTDDSDAQLAFFANEEYDGDAGEYVEQSDNGTIELTFEDINRDAVTEFDDLFVVQNNGPESVQVRVDNDKGSAGEDPIWGSGVGADGPMDIKHPEGGSMVGGVFQQTRANGDITLGSGEELTLTVRIDTRGFDDDSWVDGTLYFEAA